MPRLRELLPLVPLGACYAFIAHRNPELAQQLPLFLTFFSFFVAIPALGTGGLLIRLPLSLTERLALGSPAALAMLFGLAYAGAALRLPWLIWAQPALGLGACAASLLHARRKAGHTGSTAGGACPPAPWGDLLLILAVLSIGLAMSLPKYAAVSLPLPSIAVDYYNDDVGQAAYSFAALRALEHGLPVLQPLVAGTSLTYHFLYNFCVAACTLSTGLLPLDQITLLWPPMLWLLISCAVVTGCRRLAGFGLLEAGLASLLVLFSTGIGFYSMHAVQLFFYMHSYAVGLPALLLFATGLYGYLSGRADRLFALHCGVSYFVCATTKANLLVLLPIALLPVLVVRIIRRQSKASEVLLAGLVLTTGVLLRLGFYHDTERVALRLPNPGKLAMGLIANLGEMAIALGAYMLLAMFASEANPVLRHKLDRARQYHLFCLAFILVSAALLKMFNFIGGDFYFYWQARILVFLAFAPLAAHVLSWRTPIFAPVVASLLLLGPVFTMEQLYLAPAVSGVPAVALNKANDQGEREGLRWAAANLDRRKVFFTNKSTYLGAYLGGFIPMDLYDYLALSGLQGHAWPTAWLPQQSLRTAQERVARQKAFLDATTPEARAQTLARLDDADYYFHCIRLAPADFRPPECLREVHRTASLIIYENACRTAQPGVIQTHKE